MLSCLTLATLCVCVYVCVRAHTHTHMYILSLSLSLSLSLMCLCLYDRHHVAAIRAYTSDSFRLFNNPMRNHECPAQILRSTLYSGFAQKTYQGTHFLRISQEFQQARDWIEKAFEQPKARENYSPHIAPVLTLLGCLRAEARRQPGCEQHQSAQSDFVLLVAVAAPAAFCCLFDSQVKLAIPAQTMSMGWGQGRLAIPAQTTSNTTRGPPLYNDYPSTDYVRVRGEASDFSAGYQQAALSKARPGARLTGAARHSEG